MIQTEKENNKAHFNSKLNKTNKLKYGIIILYLSLKYTKITTTKNKNNITSKSKKFKVNKNKKYKEPPF